MIKSFVTRYVKANESTEVDTAKQFFELCQNKLTVVDGKSKRPIYFFSEREISSARTKTKDAKPLPGSRKIQSMMTNSKGTFRHCRLSCFCNSTLGHVSHLCGDRWKQVQLVNMKGNSLLLDLFHFEISKIECSDFLIVKLLLFSSISIPLKTVNIVFGFIMFLVTHCGHKFVFVT